MLPKIKHRVITTKLPSSGREVRFRPMVGREEKILLVAKETEESDEILSAVGQIVGNCVLDEWFDVSSAPIFDVEWLFIQIRMESVSAIAPVTYIDGSDGKRYDFDVDLREVVVQEVPPLPTIELGEGISVQLRWPAIRDFISADVLEAETDGEVAHHLATKSIESIFDGDQKIRADEEPRDELDQFVGSFDVDSYKRLIDHVAEIPSLRYVIEYVNSKGEEREVVLDSLTDFFRFR